MNVTDLVSAHQKYPDTQTVSRHAREESLCDEVLVPFGSWCEAINHYYGVSFEGIDLSPFGRAAKMPGVVSLSACCIVVEPDPKAFVRLKEKGCSEAAAGLARLWKIQFERVQSIAQEIFSSIQKVEEVLKEPAPSEDGLKQVIDAQQFRKSQYAFAELYAQMGATLQEYTKAKES